MSISRLRLSTQEIHKQAREIYKQTSSGRKILGCEKTATLMKGVNHNCIVEKEEAQEKARRRVYGTYLRTTISFFFECKTWRGKTEYTGENSKCGGCQGSHWSLTPTLCDDKMQRIINEILLKGLSPKKTQILRNVIGLTKEEEIELKENYSDTNFVINFFDRRVSHDNFHRLFRKTDFEYQSNSTIENPISSNTLDSRFECIVRGIEDRNCNECTHKKIPPEEGTLNVVKESIKFFKQAVDDYTQRKKHLERYIELNNDIQSFIQKYPSLKREIIQSDPLIRSEFIGFFKNIRELLELRAILQLKIKGVKTFSKVEEYRRDYYWIESLLKTYKKVFQDSFPKDNLENPDSFDDSNTSHVELLSKLASTYSLMRPNFKELPTVDTTADIAEFDRYILEANYQLELLKKYDDIEMIKALKSLFFGIFQQDTQTRREPTEEEIMWQLIDMTKKFDKSLQCNNDSPAQLPDKSPPSHSSKKNKIKDPQIETSNKKSMKRLFIEDETEGTEVKKSKSEGEKISS